MRRRSEKRPDEVTEKSDMPKKKNYWPKDVYGIFGRRRYQE